MAEVLQDDVKYDSLVIGSDEDLEVLFHCRRQFPEVRTPELLAKLVDVVSSSGGSNQNSQPVPTAACSTSRPSGASSSMHAIAPEAMLVASPSFAADLNRSGDGEVGIVDTKPLSLHGFASDGVDDVLRDDDEDDDVELDMIADESGEDIVGSNPVGGAGGSSSGTQQYPPHFSTLDLDAMRQQAISLRQRKGIWEVKWYNGPQTCLATSISSDHRSLDYHVISAFIMPMVRADAAVCIKVLLNATKAHFSFRPTYRRVWMAKQKVVAQIYGDWDESYSELPRWVLGVQVTMPGSVAMLRMSPVRVGGHVDEAHAYFHRLFWTFPPCIEAFRHCKPLVSINSTHLYGKYGGTLLVAIVKDENSNILPVAFALVEGENAESWSFFLSHLHQHVTLQPGILVISDRHNDIKAALEGKDARRLMVNAAYAKIEVEFDYWFDILRSEDPAMCDWANRIDYTLWTQHRDEG
ncbi:uncharacterized protein LOC107626856 [Arachis ipaensis]|uniref:uncharacterized protein LOC107626856 n=1 Tax=Arachis ipaensis TaxID=130454 RepID=UPI0007AF7885|nr:uncharacterized protein LOC107626856 [Arachis ipaensis]